jgi:hypothetical protein
MTERPEDRLSSMTPDEKRALLKQLLARKLSASAAEYPLSHAQRALWFFQRIAPQSAAYNVAFAAEAVPPFDAQRLSAAIDAVVRRHPALRTTFHDVDGVPIQRVSDVAAGILSVIDAGDWSDEAVTDAVREAYSRPFDLERAPVRASLFRARARDLLLVTVHHIVFDAVSAHIVFEGIRAEYEATGATPAVSPAATYADFVRWQSGMLASPREAELWEYWSQRLSGELPVLRLGHDRPGTTLSYQGDSFTLALEGSTVDRLKALAREHRTTLAAVLMAGYAVFLNRLSGQDDIIIATPVSGRTRPEWVNVVGYFVNMLPLRLHCSEALRFSEHLDRSADELRGALANQDMPFPVLVERLKARRSSGHTPVFQAVLNVHSSRGAAEFSRLFDATAIEPVRFGESFLRGFPLRQQEGQFEIAVELFDNGDQIVGGLKLMRDIFNRAQGERLARAFEQILEQIASNPDACLGTYSMPEGAKSFQEDERDSLIL